MNGRDRIYAVRRERRELRDPGTFLPVTVVYWYAANDALLYVYATNADGSEYTGDISLLIA